MILQLLFWIFLGLIGYAYLGYTLVLLLLAGIRKIIYRSKDSATSGNLAPPVTLFIPAYNELNCIEAKVANTAALNYPANLLKVVWITDGSDDGSVERLRYIDGITVLHAQERRGKIHAMNRAIALTDTPIIVFTDANTMLNPAAIHELVKRFADEKTGCVAGEKRISAAGREKAVSAGEGLYWKYESFVKWLESETGSAVGAVGELFALRRELYTAVKEDTLLDDFTISLTIAAKGYRIRYAPGAWGTETASVSIAEEMKRKIRIATGGFQTLFRMKGLLNPFRHGLLTFKYFSHKVLRWTLVPVSFPLVLLLNAAIMLVPGHAIVYTTLFIMQCIYYLIVMAGAMLHQTKPGLKVIFAPYYLLVINYAVLTGMFRYFSGRYSVNWQKVKRS